MNVADLEAVLIEAQVPPDVYCLMGTRHEALCVIAWGQQWQVFLQERDERYEFHEFDSEDAACVYFLKRIFQLSSR